VPVSQLLTPFDVFPNLPIGLTKFVGPEAKLFLQGQLTCNIDKLEPHQSLLGAHCDPKGKTLAVLRLLQDQDDIYALQHLDNTASHLPNLTKYAVFSKVTISNATSDYVFTGLSGESATAWLMQQSMLPQLPQDTLSTDFGVVTSFPRSACGQARYLIVSDHSQAQALVAALPENSTEQAATLWQALDILSATPVLTPTCQGEHVPQMLNLQMIDGISFSKGCYIGQETIARLHYRGQNKRSMFVLSAPSQFEVKSGDSLERQVESGWRNAGTVICAQALASHTVLLAILPVDSEAGSLLRLKDSDTTLTLIIPDYFDQT